MFKLTSQIAVAVSVVACGAAHASPGGLPPVFSQSSYDITVDVSPPGLQSFSMSGTVTDPDAGDIVSISCGGIEPFMTFRQTPGNPASFELRSDVLTYQHIGTLRFFFDANSEPRGGAAGIPATLRIVPEPVGLMGAVAFTAFFVRRIRRPNADR